MRRFIFILMAMAFVSGCAATGNPMAHQAGPNGELAGFWLGLWHGFICPFTFIVSLFKDTVGIYEIHNSGHWYDFGFVLGASAIFHGSSQAGRRSWVVIERRRS